MRQNIYNKNCTIILLKFDQEFRLPKTFTFNVKIYYFKVKPYFIFCVAFLYFEVKPGV